MHKFIVLLLEIPFFFSMSFGQAYMNISGGNVVVSGSSSIVLKNTSWVNNGQFDAGSGAVVFNGTTNDSIIGNTNTAFYDLRLQKSSGNLILATHTTVNDTLQFTSGQLELNGQSLTLGSTQGVITGETETNRITGVNGGTVSKTLDLHAPMAENPGNLGLTITSADNLGTTTIARGHQAQNIVGKPSVNRYFEVNPANDSGLAAMVRIGYFDAELNNQNESQLIPWSYDGNSWIDFPQLDSSTTSNYVETVVDSFDLLTLGTSRPCGADGFEPNDIKSAANYLFAGSVTASGK